MGSDTLPFKITRRTRPRHGLHLGRRRVKFKVFVATRNSFHGGCHWGFGMVGAFLASAEFLVPPPSNSDWNKLNNSLSALHLPQGLHSTCKQVMSSSVNTPPPTTAVDGGWDLSAPPACRWMSPTLAAVRLTSSLKFNNTWISLRNVNKSYRKASTSKIRTSSVHPVEGKKGFTWIVMVAKPAPWSGRLPHLDSCAALCQQSKPLLKREK